MNIREAFQGHKRLTRGQKIVQVIFMGLLAYCCVFTGWVGGFFEGTGTLPFGPQAESIVPAGIETTTSADAIAFVEDRTNLERYREGFNCVEFALMAAHEAWWEGINAIPVRIDFEDGETHLILGFPTEDKGWMFLQPEGDVWISPRVGGMFLDRGIVGVYYLYDLVWKSIGEVLQ